MFLLRDLPNESTMQEFAQIYPDMDIATTSAFLNLLKVASLLLLQLEQHFSQFKLSQARFLALVLLEREASKQQMPSEIAEKMGISKKNTARLLSSMQQEGWITQHKHPSDGRAMIVSIEPCASQLLQQLMPGYYKIMNRAMHPLDSQQKIQLTAMLTSICCDASAQT